MLGLSGVLCSILAKLSWRVLELKAAIELSIGVPVVQQQLVSGTQELDDDDELLHQALPVGSLQVTLIRRSSSQSERLRLIAERSLFELQRECIREMAETRGDRHVAVAYMQRDGRLLERLPAELRSDRRVVLAAVRRFPLALAYAEGQLRADRDVVLAAVWQDPRALEFADKALKEDSQFICDAMQGEDHLEHLLTNPKEVLHRARAVLSCAAPALQQDPLLQSTAGLRFADRQSVCTYISTSGGLASATSTLVAQLSPTVGQATRLSQSAARSRSRPQRTARTSRCSK